MPDQVAKLHDPHPHPAERYLGLYGPASPARYCSELVWLTQCCTVLRSSDSPLSLVVRKEDRRKADAGLVTDSPGRSSGYSDHGSYESSPARSPARPDQAVALSLVVRREEPGSAPPLAPPQPAAPPKKQLVEVDQDSGTEEAPAQWALGQDREEVGPLIISEDPVQYSTQPPSPPTGGIKIRAFAKLRENEANATHTEEGRGGDGRCLLENAAGHMTEGAEELSGEEEEETGSNCSADSWASSLVEGKPYSHQDSSLVLRRISRASNGESVYQCDFCDKLFANKYHLQSHLVTHTGERAFTCKICTKTFGRKSTLRAHMTTHTKVSNFMCTVCEKACNDNNSLEEHMRMHTGEKPFVCSICGKAYARKSHLNVHYRVHTGERPFVCEYCNKDFTEKRFLNDHLQTAHNGLDGPLKCPNCAREFAYKTSLKQHLKKQVKYFISATT